jgi:probable HAF family extracellular repeat protein
MKHLVFACVLTLVAVLASAALTTSSATANRPVYVMRDLGTFGGTASLARGINDSGQVVILRGMGASQAVQIASARSLVWENGRVRWLGTLAGGATAVSVINGRGQVAGQSVVRGVPHAFLWQNGKMHDLGATGGNPEAVLLGTVALNDRGEVAGTRVPKGGAPVAFLWRSGEMLNLGALPGFAGSAAYGMNEKSQVVGVSTVAGEGAGHAFLWENGTMHDIATLTNGILLTWAWAINDKSQVVAVGGRVVGKRLDEKTIRAYLWENGTIAKLDTLPGFTSSAPTAINNRGQIVGFAIAANGRRRAVLWENRRVSDLGGNTTGNTFAQAINERGQIVGGAIIDGNPHAVLWTKRG